MSIEPGASGDGFGRRTVRVATRGALRSCRAIRALVDAAILGRGVAITLQRGVPAALRSRRLVLATLLVAGTLSPVGSEPGGDPTGGGRGADVDRADTDAFVAGADVADASGAGASRAGASGAGAFAAGAFVAGADVSFLAQVEREGAVFRGASGRSSDPLVLLAGAGIEVVRLRLWYGAVEGPGGIEDGLRIARRARALGLRLWVDLHYSETWADPGHQETPRAWSGLGSEALADSVDAYTQRVLGRFRSEGLAPDFVQIGNEVGAGMLWPTGRLDWHDGRSWDRFTRLLSAGVRGARRTVPDALVLLHLDSSPGPAGVLRFLDEIRARGAEVDALGLSYYPWWHGGLDRLDAVLHALEERGQPWFLAEVAYPWSLEAFDRTGNLVGKGTPLADGYPPSAEGQALFLGALRARVVASSFGGGMLYWAPEWVSTPRAPSAWENCALFDLTGALLPGAEAMGNQGVVR